MVTGKGPAAGGGIDAQGEGAAGTVHGHVLDPADGNVHRLLHRAEHLPRGGRRHVAELRPARLGEGFEHGLVLGVQWHVGLRVEWFRGGRVCPASPRFSFSLLRTCAS